MNGMRDHSRRDGGTSRAALAVLVTIAVVVGCKAPWAREETAVVPAGTVVKASLRDRLSTDVNRSGDGFEATTLDAVVVDGKTVVPAGATMRGRLTNVQESGRVKGRAQMTLVVETLVDAKGATHALATEPIGLQAESGTHDDVEKIAAGGIAGAIIGGITGGKKGAAIGAVIGAGAGTGVVLATKGDDIELAPGQKLNVRITAPAELPVIAQKSPSKSGQ